MPFFHVTVNISLHRFENYFSKKREKKSRKTSNWNASAALPHTFTPSNNKNTNAPSLSFSLSSLSLSVRWDLNRTNKLFSPNIVCIHWKFRANKTHNSSTHNVIKLVSVYMWVFKLCQPCFIETQKRFSVALQSEW